MVHGGDPQLPAVREVDRKGYERCCVNKFAKIGYHDSSSDYLENPFRASQSLSP